MENIAEQAPTGIGHVNDYLEELHSATLGLAAVRTANIEVDLQFWVDEHRHLEDARVIGCAGEGAPQNAATIIHKTEEKMRADSIVREEVFDDPVTELEEPERRKLKSSWPSQVTQVRKKIQKLTPDQQDLLDDYCYREAPALFKAIISQKAKTGDPVTWSDWLGQQATDEQLLNFLQKHTYDLKQLQSSREVRSIIADQRLLYKQNVKQGIDDGWIHPSAVVAIDKVDNVKVYLGDIFDTLMKDFVGYHWSGSDNMVLAAPNISPTINYLRLAMRHESNHAALGSLGARWSNEAWTEHIASSFIIGQPDIIDPQRREGDNLMYLEERELLAAYMGDIPAYIGTLAYSAQPQYPMPRINFARRTDYAWEKYMRPPSRMTSRSLTRLSNHVAKLERENTGHEAVKTKRQVQQIALIEAKKDLLLRPEVIFGAAKQVA